MLAAQPCVAAEVGPRVTGPVEVVFDWSRDRCARWDIPDAPARAWRVAGQVHLIAGAEVNRAAVGPDLEEARRECAVVYQGDEKGDPAEYDDRGWIASVHVAGGTRVEALVHGEYHGNLRPERCAAAEYMACWRNAIVAAVSEDGGARFTAAGLVAALPYRYTGVEGKRTGYFNPSNMLRVGEYLYVFVFAEEYRAQKRGACLLRRPVEGGEWRGWDGADFTARFVDPYREDVVDPSAHVCAPIPGLGGTVSSVVRREGGGYLAVMPMVGAAGSGIYAVQSEDLIQWSAPALLWAAPLLWRRDCGAGFAYAYPSLIDPESGSADFDTVGEDFWLYLTRMVVGADCAVGAERDLTRMRVSWPATAAR